jgi:N-glycosylase/DNA lyase
MVQSLCRHYSPPLLSERDPSLHLEVPTEVQTYHPFPPPAVLARPDVGPTLRSLGFGYRADFIQKTAKMLVDRYSHEENPGEHAERWLASLRGLDTLKAREELLRFMGVGRKVADCVLLMSLDKVRYSNCRHASVDIRQINSERSYTSRYPCPQDCSQTLRLPCTNCSEHVSKTI